MFNKYYRKIGDVDIEDPFKHIMWGALMWMVLVFKK